jgi:hypothetical protein
VILAGEDHPSREAISPDGRWLAYIARSSGRTEVFVQSYPIAGPRRQVSVGGGGFPVWRWDGKELFYRSGSAMVAVPIDTSNGLSWGKPVELFVHAWSGFFHPYDVARDGRFLMIVPAPEENGATRLNVVINWASELAARVPVRK